MDELCPEWQSIIIPWISNYLQDDHPQKALIQKHRVMLSISHIEVELNLKTRFCSQKKAKSG